MASKHDHHWTFGMNAHLDFAAGGPADAGAQGFITEEGCATIADNASGALLFYTDGRALYDKFHNVVPLTPPTATLGGNVLSTHSAIIVPPAGGGSRYHIFGVDQWEIAGTGKPVTYTAVTLTGAGLVNQPVTPTALTAIGPQANPPHQGASERLAAISHKECDKYWVIAQSVDGGHGALYAMLVDSDAMPTVEVVTPYPFSPAVHQNCVKFSPDGTLFAVANQNVSNLVPARIDILSFNRATGAFAAHSQITGFPAVGFPYGVEFSPNSQYLYFSDRGTGQVRRHAIGAPGTYGLNTTAVVSQWPSGTNVVLGALQLGPNGKIYGAISGTSTLLEIGNPDFAGASPTPSDVQFLPVALAANGAPLSFAPQRVFMGLPTFTRIADSCRDLPPVEDDRCAKLAAEVDEQLAGVKKFNALRPCDDSQLAELPECHPLEMPPIAPWTSISWGDSKCDCIEGDDTEVMHLTVCNPYKNLTLSNLTVQQLVVVDANGNPVPNLPDGSPSIQLVPIGPYCFDDIAPCTCVTREFVLRLRGAPGGPYHILVKGICFDACFHGDGDGCFQFDVCKD
jgi:hypothetical protein